MPSRNGRIISIIGTVAGAALDPIFGLTLLLYTLVMGIVVVGMVGWVAARSGARMIRGALPRRARRRQTRVHARASVLDKQRCTRPATQRDALPRRRVAPRGPHA